MKHKIFLIVAISILAWACRPAVPNPKPKGYYRIEFPNHSYKWFDSTGFPYKFQYPTYAVITRDSNLTNEGASPYWINIYYPDFDATIYLSYKQITESNTLARLMDESYKMSFAHNIRADFIKDPKFTTANGLQGVFYTVGGNAASTYQFLLTDERAHFIRGAMYYNVSPNIDSLAPINAFMRQDLDKMIETFSFK